MGKLSRNLRICGDCGIAYTSVSFTKYIDQCPICKSRRYEAIPIKTELTIDFNIDFLIEQKSASTLSEDPEIARIMQKKMDEMLKPKAESPKLNRE